MPYEVTVDHDARTITLRGSGDGTTADTIRLVREQQDTFRACAGYDMLYDSSALRIDSATPDMMRVAEALFAEVRARFRKLAIVVPPERVPLARIFTALADPHGIRANVFEDAADARRWLAEPVREGPGR